MSEHQPIRHVLAVDIGGTKLAAAVVAANGAVLAEARAPTPTSDGEEVFRTLLMVCRDVLDRASVYPVEAVGVGCAGPMRYPEGIVSPLNAPAWREFPLRDRLSQAFGLPCIVDNDAKAVALGEHWLGVGRGSSNVLGMVVSTGVGGGLVVDGRLLHGAHGNAGHIGHVIVVPGGPECACGARGCVEAIASGTSIARRYAAARESGNAGTLPGGATAAEIATAARDGDALAVRLFAEAGEAVGRGIASTAALADVDVAAIGGSVALRAWDLLAPALEAEIRRSACLSFTRDIRVCQAALGDRAGLIGAAALGFDLLAPA